MHIQPNSISIRKYIPTQEYLNLQKQQENLSLIMCDLSTIDNNLIIKRINELKEQEEKGFVYVGERNWLQEFLDSDKNSEFKSYSNWVLNNFENHLGISYKPTQDIDNPKQIVWEAIMNAENLNLDLKEFSNLDSTLFDELELAIVGDQKNISKDHLIKLFEMLHNFEYILNDLYLKIPDYSDITLLGVDFKNSSDTLNWQLILISEYGAEFDINYNNYKLIPFNKKE
ncbi:MAG: hypothetical protein N4A49_11600 [Marinifilaceae bacterium]|jgi:hypothetical protein|nr:hypothetical protein [Marinifilaceae bacterium]